MSRDTGFEPRLAILPAPQRSLWDELNTIPASFTLYGGTALALRLGHRQSVDFDFFDTSTFEPRYLTNTLALLADATIIQQAPNTLSAIVERGGPVRLSFFGLPGLVRLRPPDIAVGNGLRIASLLDLAGTKAAVVQQRAEAKDYLDLDALVRDGRIDLATALAAAKAIYGRQFNPLITLKALSFYEDGDLHRLPQAVRHRLTAAVRRVDPERLTPVVPQGSAR